MSSDLERARDRDGGRLAVCRELFSAALGAGQSALLKVRRIQLALHELEKDNRDLVTAGVSVVLGALVFAMWLPAVYTVDATILRPTSEYLVDMFAPAAGGWRTFAVYALPVALIALDVPLGLAVARAQGIWAALWLAFAVVWTLAMPWFAWSAYVAGAGAPTTLEARLQLVGLCSLAFVAHGSLVFGGAYLDHYFKCLLFTLRRWSSTSALERQSNAFVSSVATCDARFSDSCEAVRTYNRDYPNDVLVSPVVPSDLVALRAAAQELLVGRAVAAGEPERP